MNRDIWKKIQHELRPSYLFRQGLGPSIISGILIGLMTSVLSISFAVLVFGEAIHEALPIGIGMALFSNVILHLFSAFTSSGEGVMSHVQSLPPPIQAAMLSSVMAMLPLSMSIENKTLMAVFVVLFSSILTGGVLFLFGWLKFGNLVRFLPMPVISGFLASVGFALVLGGMATMTTSAFALSALSAFFELEMLLRWGPGLLLAVGLWVVMARWKHQLVFPGVLVFTVVVFYGIYAVQGLGAAELMAENLLLGPFPEGQLWQSPHIYCSQLDALDWSVISSQIGIILTIPLACSIGGLLMVSAIEFSTGSEMDPNHELKAMGAGNFFSGILGGGFMGYPSTTFTIMQYSLGATTRLAGILSVLVPIVVLVLGAGFLGYIPRFVIGGLLIYFGYQFVHHYVIKPFRQTAWTDLGIMAAIVATSIWIGFVQSAGVGVLASAIFFLFKYSQISVIRYTSTGAVLRSRVTRNAIHHDWLSAHADSIAVFGLQGYIFFGTAHNLHEQIMVRVMDKEQRVLDSIILDFRHVTGIDTSVVESFHKLYLQLQQKGIMLIFAQMPLKNQKKLQFMGFFKENTEGFAKFDSLDAALESREDYLLTSSNLPIYQSRTLLDVFTDSFKNTEKAGILLQYLERMEVSKGTNIIEQNTTADDLFFIESGRISTYAERENSAPLRLQTMVEDTMVGEIGFYLGQSRTATVTADEQSIVYRLSIDALKKVEQEQPAVALELHKLMAEQSALRINHVSNSLRSFM